MAVTFAGLISQDQKPLSCCWGPSHRWLWPGNPKCLGGWDVCQPHCWKPLSTSSYFPCQYPSAVSCPLPCIPAPWGWRFCLSSICAALSSGALNPSRGDRLLPRVKAIPRCGHTICSRRVHLMQRAVWTDLDLLPVYTLSCGFYYTLREDTDSSHVPPKICLSTPFNKKHPCRSGDSWAGSGVFRPGLQSDLKDGD